MSKKDDRSILSKEIPEIVIKFLAKIPDDCNIVDQAHLFDTINFDAKKMTGNLLLNELELEQADVENVVKTNHHDDVSGRLCITNRFLKAATKAMRMRLPTFKMYAGCTLGHCPLGPFYRALYNVLKRHMMIVKK
jgi:hypothetical protein